MQIVNHGTGNKNNLASGEIFDIFYVPDHDFPLVGFFAA